jgi:solute carrier family 10 (sodium/bile acid cotransporter), member 7
VIWLKRNWFIAGLGSTLVVSALAPAIGKNGGWLALDALRSPLIVVIFLILGLSLDPRELRQALVNVRLHAFVQSLSLVIAPVIFWLLSLGLAAAMHGAFDHTLLSGLVVLGCLPTTITSSVVYTREAGGNVAAALFNATLGNSLGVVVAPLSIVLLLGQQGQMQLLPAVVKLGSLVVLPVLVGQVARRVSPKLATLSRSGSIVINLCLLLIIFNSISDSVDKGISATAGDIATVVAVALFGHVLLLAAAWFGSSARWLGFSPADRVAATLCASQKTIALGIPLIHVMFGEGPHVMLLALPALVYHPFQLFLGAFLLPRWRAWVAGTRGA